MIKAIMLTFEPAMTWDRIMLARKSFSQVFFLFLTPLILLSVGCEMAGLFYFGKRLDYGPNLHISEKIQIVYGVTQFVFSYAVVFIGAKLIKSLSETFHSRHTYTQAFTVVAYGLSPLFLMRLLDVFPNMNPWGSFGIGIAICVMTLYHGVPRILQPDPPNAFGVYLTSALLLGGVTGLARYLTLLLLQGKIRLF